MYETHEGLSKDYEVSCVELDFLVEQTLDKEEVLGARLMGGGFGGCTLNIVKTEKVADFIQQMTVSYQHQFNRNLVCHVVEITEGVEKIK